MALILSNGGKPTEDLILGVSNSGAASWCTIPASVHENYTQIRMLSNTEANDAVATVFRHGNYSNALQVGDGASTPTTITTTPVALSTLPKASNGSIAWRVNTVDAYNGVALIP